MDTHEFQYGEPVIWRGQGAVFRAYWPDKILSTIMMNSGRSQSVRSIELHRLPEDVECPGCGELMSGEYELCRACEREQQAERAADERAGR